MCFSTNKDFGALLRDNQKTKVTSDLSARTVNVSYQLPIKKIKPSEVFSLNCRKMLLLLIFFLSRHRGVQIFPDATSVSCFSTKP